MTSGPRTPVAPNTAPGTPSPDGTFPAGVDSIDEGFKGSTVMETTDDGKPASFTPELPLPEGATVPEQEVADELEDFEEDEEDK